MLLEIYEYDIISNDTVNPSNNGIMESYYYLTGHLGTITDIVDENIGIAQYSSFGSLLSSTGIFTEQPYGYTSRRSITFPPTGECESTIIFGPSGSF